MLVLVAVDMPDGLDVYAPDIGALPAGWDTQPTSSAAQAFGGAWLATGNTLGMLVPSVVVHEEKNMILNPAHLAYARVTLSVVRPFVFDRRPFK